MVMAAPSVSWADIVPSPLFADHMVIQRGTQAPVWGTADAGEKVTVTCSWGESAATTTTPFLPHVFRPNSFFTAFPLKANS